MRNRSHNVMVRMDDEEYNQFCTNVKESGQTKQAYVTNAVLHVPVMPKEELEEVQKISQLMADEKRNDTCRRTWKFWLHRRRRSGRHALYRSKACEDYAGSVSG